MNLLFNSTEDFEQDLRTFDDATRQSIVERVNSVAQSFIENKSSFARQARQPYRIELNNGFDSSLYSVRVEPGIRLVLTIENDPLFEQVNVTLMRVVKRGDLREAYETAARNLYQHLNGHKPPQGVKVG